VVGVHQFGAPLQLEQRHQVAVGVGGVDGAHERVFVRLIGGVGGAVGVQRAGQLAVEQAQGGVGVGQVGGGHFGGGAGFAARLFGGALGGLLLRQLFLLVSLLLELLLQVLEGGVQRGAGVVGVELGQLGFERVAQALLQVLVDGFGLLELALGQGLGAAPVVQSRHVGLALERQALGLGADDLAQRVQLVGAQALGFALEPRVERQHHGAAQLLLLLPQGAQQLGAAGAVRLAVGFERLQLLPQALDARALALKGLPGGRALALAWGLHEQGGGGVGLGGFGLGGGVGRCGA